MKVNNIDHLVLTVKDIKSSCAFYTRVLGMKEVTFEGERKAVIFGDQKLNFHQQGEEFGPKALRPTPGAIDLCFVTSDPLPEVISHLRACGVEIIAGPVERTGALGPITSVYFRDPDQNLIEVSIYKNLQVE
jgi:catechol 2,3-dioxygenase-like lactoylglutathione lyase family enzyme